jgi:ABC-type sulfate/molybdate transport systems ATPase subunit
VLLLDEPTSGLDATAERQVEQLLAETVSRQPTAVLLVTHRPEQARDWCQRIVDFARFL